MIWLAGSPGPPVSPATAVLIVVLVLLGTVALFAALYPANRAAAVDPIEALRFEAGG